MLRSFKTKHTHTKSERPSLVTYFYTIDETNFLTKQRNARKEILYKTKVKCKINAMKYNMKQVGKRIESHQITILDYILMIML